MKHLMVESAPRDLLIRIIALEKGDRLLVSGVSPEEVLPATVILPHNLELVAAN